MCDGAMDLTSASAMYHALGGFESISFIVCDLPELLPFLPLQRAFAVADRSQPRFELAISKNYWPLTCTKRGKRPIIGSSKYQMQQIPLSAYLLRFKIDTKWLQNYRGVLASLLHYQH